MLLINETPMNQDYNTEANCNVALFVLPQPHMYDMASTKFLALSWGVFLDREMVDLHMLIFV